MSVPAVVRKDYRDGIRSKLLWALIAAFLVSIGGFALLATRSVQEGAESGGSQLLGLMGFAVIFAVIVLIPITGLVVSIKSIVRERELGSLKILLSLPHSRAEVVAGKFLGRAGLLTTAILAGFLPAGLVFLLRIDDFPVYEYVVFVLVTILFGVVFVAVGIGLSALVSTETRATVGGIGAFFVLLFWNQLFGYVNDQLDLLSGNGELFVERFYLFNVFFDSLMALLSIRDDEVPGASIVAYSEMAVPEPGAAPEIASQPFYLQHWFAFVILALWIAIPLAIGYYWFENADL